VERILEEILVNVRKALKNIPEGKDSLESQERDR